MILPGVIRIGPSFLSTGLPSPLPFPLGVSGSIILDMSILARFLLLVSKGCRWIYSVIIWYVSGFPLCIQEKQELWKTLLEYQYLSFCVPTLLLFFPSFRPVSLFLLKIQGGCVRVRVRVRPFSLSLLSLLQTHGYQIVKVVRIAWLVMDLCFFFTAFSIKPNQTMPTKERKKGAHEKTQTSKPGREIICAMEIICAIISANCILLDISLTVSYLNILLISLDTEFQ